MLRAARNLALALNRNRNKPDPSDKISSEEGSRLIKEGLEASGFKVVIVQPERKGSVRMSLVQNDASANTSPQ
jgi:hypothetical protein